MNDIIELFNKTTAHDDYTADISLTAQLEVIVKGYVVDGEGGSSPDEWVRVYYSKNIDSQYLIAYVSLNSGQAFVLSDMSEKFKQDSKGYGLKYFDIFSFDDSDYFCSSSANLPEEFNMIQWIDDDFMNDYTIPFDCDAFEKINSGIKYLNPNHFSINRLMSFLYPAYRR